MDTFSVAIIGFAASGGSAGKSLIDQTLVMGHERSVELHVFEPGPMYRGRAYGTISANHYFNVPVESVSTPRTDMSLVQGCDGGPNGYLPNSNARFPLRKLVGDRLEDWFGSALEEASKAGMKVEIHRKRVIAIEENRAQLVVETEDGAKITVDAMINAQGNLPSNRFPEFAGHPRFFVAKLDGRPIDGLPLSGRGAIMGSSLSADDMASDVFDSGFRGQLDMLSPSGKKPDVRQIYDETFVAPLDILNAVRTAPPGMRLRAFLDTVAENTLILGLPNCQDTLFTEEDEPMIDRLVRQLNGAEKPSLMSSLTRALDRDFGECWKLFDPKEAQFFLDNLESGYKRRAFPMANGKAKNLIAWLEAGTVEVHAILGRPMKAGNGFICTLANGEERHYDFLIDATGADINVTRTKDPLLHIMSDRGLIEAHPQGGVKVDPSTGLALRKGRVDPRIAFTGTLTKGVFYEVNDLSHNIKMAGHAGRVVACNLIRGKGA